MQVEIKAGLIIILPITQCNRFIELLLWPWQVHGLQTLLHSTALQSTLQHSTLGLGLGLGFGYGVWGMDMGYGVWKNAFRVGDKFKESVAESLFQTAIKESFPECLTFEAIGQENAGN